MDGVGTAAVGVIEVAAKSGDFDMCVSLVDQNYAEMSAYLTGVGKRRRISAGTAEVATSKSFGTRPRSKSRTQPPTSHAEWPCARNCLTIDPARLSFVTILILPC
jgi:hypothetical protein